MPAGGLHALRTATQPRGFIPTSSTTAAGTTRRIRVPDPAERAPFPLPHSSVPPRVCAAGRTRSSGGSTSGSCGSWRTARTGRRRCPRCAAGLAWPHSVAPADGAPRVWPTCARLCGALRLRLTPWLRTWPVRCLACSSRGAAAIGLALAGGAHPRLARHACRWPEVSAPSPPPLGCRRAGRATGASPAGRREWTRSSSIEPAGGARAGLWLGAQAG